MTGAADLLAALELPAGTRVDQRVPKKLLLENGAPTAADKRAINDGIEEIRWLAAIKPAIAGVPVYRDAVREYLEIAVVQAHWREGAKVARLTELIHRAIPYPVALVAEQDGAASISLANKRWAHNEAGKTVLDDDVESTRLADTEPNVVEAFLRALPLAQQPRGSMWTLYGGWESCLAALQAAKLTGRFVLLDTDERKAARRAALRRVLELRERIAQLRRTAVAASQLARQVELNIQIQKLQTQLAAAQEQL
jgi:hypothetical protein